MGRPGPEIYQPLGFGMTAPQVEQVRAYSLLQKLR